MTGSGPAPSDITGPTLIRARVDPEAKGMVPVKLMACACLQPSRVDLYLPVLGQDNSVSEMQLICPRGQALKPSWLVRFEKAGVRTLCVRKADLGVLLGDLRVRAEALVIDPAAPMRRKAAILVEMSSLTLRVMLLGAGRDQRKVEQACELAGRAIELFLSESEILDNVGHLLVTSSTIYDHSLNVCLMTLVLGRVLGLDKAHLHSLGLGALLHDVGMAKLPAEILNKPGKLTPEERARVNKHPKWGYQILALTKSIPYDALNVVMNHHERADGQGYPAGLNGAAIPYLARLTRVVDMYDAMTSPRPYRGPLTASMAASILMKESADKLDTELAVQFIRTHREAFI